MKTVPVSAKGLEILRTAARDFITGNDHRTYHADRRADLIEALREADDRLAAAQRKEAG
jgi:hypothetical protein